MPKDIDFDQELDTLTTRMNALKKGIDTLDTLFKKKRGEFETIHGGLWEGKKAIEEDRAALAAAADDATRKRLTDQIADGERTFGAMEAKLGQIIRALDDMGATARNLMAEVGKEVKNIDGLGKKLKRTGGDIKEMRAWSKTLKGLERLSNEEGARAQNIKDEVDGLPPLPTL